MIERTVNVGDKVEPGQVVARLEREPARTRCARPGPQSAAARGQLVEARADFGASAIAAAKRLCHARQFDHDADGTTMARRRRSRRGRRPRSTRPRTSSSFTELMADAPAIVTGAARSRARWCRPGA